MKLLIIEDNPLLAAKIRRQLSRWYVAEVANSGDAGLRAFANQTFAAALIDLGLPDIPGLEVCKRIRELNSEVPVLVLTGVDTTKSRVELLNAGADDYLTKPFDIQELHARINALLRRRSKTIANSIQVGNLSIYPSERRVFRDGTQIELRRKEYDILEYLVQNCGRIASRQMIINHVWPETGRSWIGSVDVHVKQLRDKVDKPFSYPLIKTCYGVGYAVECPVEIKQKGELRHEKSAA